MAGGVDYCDGLSSYGITPAKALKLIEKARTSVPFIREGTEYEGRPTRRHVKVDMNAIVRTLIDIRPGKIRKNSIKELNAEFNQILFCLLYFIGKNICKGVIWMRLTIYG